MKLHPLSLRFLARAKVGGADCIAAHCAANRAALRFLEMETRQIRCPTCRKRGDWFAGQWGPFCSRRCKMVDLGKWLGEENVISEPLSEEEEIFSRKDQPAQDDELP